MQLEIICLTNPTSDEQAIPMTTANTASSLYNIHTYVHTAHLLGCKYNNSIPSKWLVFCVLHFCLLAEQTHVLINSTCQRQEHLISKWENEERIAIRDAHSHIRRFTYAASEQHGTDFISLVRLLGADSIPFGWEVVEWKRTPRKAHRNATLSNEQQNASMWIYMQIIQQNKWNA